jgi:hypothetical protein
METMVIDRETRPETILSFMGVGARAKISKQDVNTIVVTPAPAEDDEPDYDEIAAIYNNLLSDMTGRKFDRNMLKEYKEISAIFKDLLVDMTGHKFDRDEANDYD